MTSARAQDCVIRSKRPRSSVCTDSLISSIVLTYHTDRLLRSQEWNASFRHYFDAFDNHRQNLHEAITIWCGEAIQKLVKGTVPSDPSLTRIRAYFDSSVEDHSGAFPPPQSRINGPDDQAPDLSQEMWDETDGDSVGNLVLSNAVIFKKKFALQEHSIARRSENRAVDTVSCALDLCSHRLT